MSSHWPATAINPSSTWDNAPEEHPALAQFSASILAPELEARLPDITQHVLPLAPEALQALVLRLARRCWAGELAAITPRILLAEIRDDARIPAEVTARVKEILATGPDEALRSTPSVPVQKRARLAH